MNIDELKRKAARLGYELVKKPDEIFLLSDEEYEKYKHNIPQINTWWWLRTTSDHNSDFVKLVSSNGSVRNYSYSFVGDTNSVRPALIIPYLNVGERVIKYDFPWIAIDDNLAIAEVPIAFRRFDEKSSEYETSEIREFLQDWVMSRSENYD